MPDSSSAGHTFSLSALSDLLSDKDQTPAVSEQEAAQIADDTIVCWCNNVSAGEIRQVLADGTATDLESVQRCTRATGGCGKCLATVTAIVECELHRAGR
ncbi:(2Fe-2S)-binding protein [Rarobacter incanus]|uniref:(2Fe-2S)-binding protein n=1 Tax=Rarobacter incanus TaxID=153494 RepID=UPI0011512DB5|nr:(2Fe-2S)-binding protein [Rarobacter incanus]